MSNHKISSIILLFLLSTLTLFSAVKTKTVTDMAGRKVTIPVKITRVFSSNLIGTVTVYCLNPDKVSGWNSALRPGEKKFIPEQYWNLPVIGGWSGNPKSQNRETLLANKPDVIFASPAEASQIEASRMIQEETGIPVLMIDQRLDQIDAMIKFVGEVIGEPKRAKVLAAYAAQVLEDNQKLLASIPEQERKRIYYAEGINGLQTDPPGSFHTEVIDIAGAINVAREVAQKSQQGIIGASSVSFEQVAAWAPDLIFVSDNTLANSGKAFYKKMADDPLWSGLKAVKNGQVFRIPTDPWDWFDRPPSINRLIGLKWAEAMLYPGRVTFDLKKEIVEFYQLFYRVQLSDGDIALLLDQEGGR